MNKGFVKLVASGLYTGYSPIVPGTTGSVLPWLIGYFWLSSSTPLLLAATVVMFGIAVWSAGAAETIFGHDAKKIVTDEWVGMFIAFILVPFSLTNYLIAFVAFRFFDVVKIPPAAQAERLPGGWGVTMDDVVAGVQANIATQLVIWLLARWGTA